MTAKLEDSFPVDFNGFLYRKGNNAFIINSREFDKAIKIMKENNLKHLEINSAFFNHENLSFISKFQFIEELSLVSPSVRNISPIQVLTELKGLNISFCLPGEIDFQIFENLERCSFTWGLVGSETIFNVPSLRKLRLDDYNKYEIIPISNLKELISLELINSKLLNLIGIINLEKLKELDLTGSKYLGEIKQIDHLQSLEELRIDECKKLSTLESIGALEALRSLSFSDFGELFSIKYLDALVNLEEIFFVGKTNILDGNLNSLKFLHQEKKLKTAYFRYRKHYSHKPEDLGYKVPDIVANIFRSK